MALNPDMSNWVNLKIFEELAKCCDAMNLNGADRKVYEMCRNDFWSYIKFLETNYMKVESVNVGIPRVMEFHINQNLGIIHTYVSEEE
jgi:hypothetical protein